MKNSNPPALAEKLVNWFCKEDLAEEILGDLCEYYKELVEMPNWKRKIYYWFHVINFLRPFALKNLGGAYRMNHYGIIKNYYKTSFRSLMRNPLGSFITLFGLSSAIGICVLGYSFTQYVDRMDQFHEHKNEVYLTTFFADRDGKEQQNGMSPTPLAKMLQQDFTQISKVCRVEDRSVVVKYENKVFHEKVRFTDPQFLEMLTFPMKWGVSGSLADVNSIILSEKMSVKYFGLENPVGNNIQIILSENVKKVFRITGVARKIPSVSTIDFNFLINFENFNSLDQEYDLNNWTEFVNATLIQVDHAEDLLFIEDRMDKYKELQNEKADDWKISSFSFVPLASLYKVSEGIRNDISNDSYSVMYMSKISFFIIATLILILAATNYINIAIVSASKRMKEIGLRKVIGASRRMVVFQFLAENMLIMSFALLFGFILGTTVFVPWLENSSNFDMDFTLLDRNLWIFLPSVMFFAAIVSGLYPALFISGYQVTTIFRGSFKIGTKGQMTKIFLGFQMVLACILISIAVMFKQNTAYQSNRSWGYEQSSVLYVDAHTPAAFDQMRSKVLQNPDVLYTSGSEHHLGRSNGIAIVNTPDRDYEVHEMLIDENYFTTMGLELIAGLDFKSGDHGNESILVNETFVENLSILDPIGSVVKIDSFRYVIRGVVKDFHSYTFFTKIKPTFFKQVKDGEYRYLSLKVKPGSEYNTKKELEEHWATLFPEIPFKGGHQDDVWGNYREEMESGSRFWKALALVVVLIVSLGLYGLVTLNISGRLKEFSIRKVLGAKLKNISSQIVSQYLLVFFVALLIGSIAGYYITEGIFDTFFIYRIPMNYSGGIVSSSVLVGILLVVAGIQVRKIINSNPVEGLRTE